MEAPDLGTAKSPAPYVGLCFCTGHAISSGASSRYGRVPILIACNRAGAHTHDILRYIGYVSMPLLVVLFAQAPFMASSSRVCARDRGLYQDGRYRGL